MASDTEDELPSDLFQEPADYYPPEKPATFASYELVSGETLDLRLVGGNPLWGHMLWNAGKVTARYLEEHAEQLVKDKDVLELGAGAGLPSLVCQRRGARKVLITDYPDTDLLENLKWNVEHCCENTTTPAENVSVQGYVWGASLPASMSPGFDLVILADLIFNHSEQEKLIATVRQTLRRKKDATALVFYTPHRPWLMEKDLAFFELARSEGFVVEKLLEEVMEKAMFDNDRGDEITRRTVFGYAFRWPTSMLAE